MLQERASAPFANLLTSSVLRIHALKRGPFHEHSPILSDVSRTVPNFAKVAAGMLKMWRAECTGKRPVVQHFVFGGVGFVWDGPEPSDDEWAMLDTLPVLHETSRLSCQIRLTPRVDGLVVRLAEVV